jgi:hypothetical protein
MVKITALGSRYGAVEEYCENTQTLNARAGGRFLNLKKYVFYQVLLLHVIKSNLSSEHSNSELEIINAPK